MKRLGLCAIALAASTAGPALAGSYRIELAMLPNGKLSGRKVPV